MEWRFRGLHTRKSPRGSAARLSTVERKLQLIRQDLDDSPGSLNGRF